MLLIVYAVAVLLLIAISFLVAYNFVRYRFEGDLTVAFMAAYAGTFVALVILTLALLPAANSALANPF